MTSELEVPWEEEFVLAKDKQLALNRLLPSTEDYLFYHILHFLNVHGTPLDEKTEELMETYARTFQYSARLKLLRRRIEFINLESCTSKEDKVIHCDSIRNLFGVTTNRSRAHAESIGELKPSKCEPNEIEAKYSQPPNGYYTILNNEKDINRIAFHSLERNIKFFESRRAREIINQLPKAGPVFSFFNRLFEKALRDYKEHGITDISSVYRGMPFSDFDAIAQAYPNLYQQDAFQQAFISKMYPVVMKPQDPAFGGVAKTILQFFSQNVKSPFTAGTYFTVMHHLLRWYQLTGQQTSEEAFQRFREYVRFPRPNSSLSLTQKMNCSNFLPVSRGNKFTRVSDEEDRVLLRAYLCAYYKDPTANVEEFYEFLDEKFVRKTVAKAKLYHHGDISHSEVLDHASFQAMKDSIIVDFLPSNKQQYQVSEPIILQLRLKRVATLITKFYELNTLGYYLQHGKEIDAAISVDGLMPSDESTNLLEQTSPFQIIHYTAPCPAVNYRGVFIVEVIGNGISSRALIRKGRLSIVDKLTEEGQYFYIFNELSELEKKSAMYMNGKRYDSNEFGELFLPFATSQCTEHVILLDSNGFATLTEITRKEEHYSFSVAITLDRESLLPSALATAFIRPVLSFQNQITDLSRLSSLRCTVLTETAKNQQIVNNESLFDLSSLHTADLLPITFSVPSFLRKVSIRVEGTVVKKNKKEQNFSETESYYINHIEDSEAIADCFLRISSGDFILFFCGRNGEALKDRSVNVSFYYTDLPNHPNSFSCQTDEHGHIRLGPLCDVDRIHVESGDISKGWPVRSRLRFHFPSVIHAYTDDLISIPCDVTGVASSLASLIRVVQEESIEDFSSILSTTPNALCIPSNTLPQGNYELRWKLVKGEKTVVRVVDRAAFQAIGQSLISPTIILDAPTSTKRVTIEHIKKIEGKKELQVKLGHASSACRVHVVACQFFPAFQQFEQIQLPNSNIKEPSYTECDTAQESKYLSGRELSDEYRYIINRKYQEHFPHLLLEKPTMLSIPYSKQEVKNSQGFANLGTRYKDAGRCMRDCDAYAKLSASCLEKYRDTSSMNFLDSSIAAFNCVPSDDGIVCIPMDGFDGGHHFIQVIVTNGSGETVALNFHENSSTSQDSTTTTTPSSGSSKITPLVLRNLTLEDPLPLSCHYVQKSQLSIVSGKTSLKFGEGVSSSDVSVFESLENFLNAKMKSNEGSTLYTQLESFQFLLTWEKNKEEEKKQVYSRFASHEFHFFLKMKDPSFFKAHAVPHILLKQKKTFMDTFLLDDKEGLRKFLSPAIVASLNLVERILLAHALTLKPLMENIIAECCKKEKVVVESFRVRRPLKKKKKSVRRSSMCMQNDSEEEEDCCMSSEEEYLEVSRSSAPTSFTHTNQNTRQYQEQSYFEQTTTPVIKASLFWADYAKHLSSTWDSPSSSLLMLSRHLLDVGNNLTSILFGLSVLELPGVSTASEMECNASGVLSSISTGPTPLVIQYKELVEEPLSSTLCNTIAVIQCFFRSGKMLAPSADFLPKCVYKSRVVLMNSSTDGKTVQLLYQIPSGAIPLAGAKMTSFTTHRVASYSTEFHEVSFYFPAPGNYSQYPPHVSLEGTPIVVGKNKTFSVVKRLTNVEKNWTFLCDFGTDEEVLAMLSVLNGSENEISLISWRLEKVEFYEKVIFLLRSRFLFRAEVWAWSFTHSDEQGMKEYLQSMTNLDHTCGPNLKTKLVDTTDCSFQQGSFQYMEYDPLVAARAHQFGARRKILNDGLRTQYTKFVKRLCFKSSLSGDDTMELCYFLLLMNRQAEAFRFFAEREQEEWLTPQQSPFLHYFVCYMYFLRGEFTKAKKIGEAAAKDGKQVARMEVRFRTLLDQIKQVEDGFMMEETKVQCNSSFLAAEVSEEGKNVFLKFRQTSNCTISYFLMDIEFLFSNNPFMNDTDGSEMEQFAIMKPSFVKELLLDDLPVENTIQNYSVFSDPIPPAFLTNNVMIEVFANGKYSRFPRFSHSLQVRFSASLLQVIASDTKKPISTAYVKVYYKNGNNGSAAFYKDGYTDPRGMFDFMCLTGNSKLNASTKFSILVIAKENGSIIVEPSHN